MKGYVGREFEFEEDDPFVKEALRKRGANELCWCGSGKKFKKCHRDREQQKRLKLGQLQAMQRKVFWRARGCMHPQASSATCSGKVIDSHTIQRKGPLAEIVDKTNHVYRLKARHEHGLQIELEKVGWKNASTFPGFCSKHDSTLFEKLELETFSGSHEQCVLQSFRVTCNEHYRKIALIESFELMRNHVDRGKNLDGQINAQLSFQENIRNNKKSVEENLQQFSLYETAILNDRFSDFESKVYFFDGKLEVVSSTNSQVDFDFQGNELCDLWNLEIDADFIAYGIMPTENGGAFFFCWHKDQDTSRKFIESFEQIPDNDKPDIFMQYCFLTSKNTYFSKDWWERRSSVQQERVKELTPSLFSDGGSYLPTMPPLVNWKIT